MPRIISQQSGARGLSFLKEQLKFRIRNVKEQFKFRIRNRQYMNMSLVEFTEIC